MASSERSRQRGAGPGRLWLGSAIPLLPAAARAAGDELVLVPELTLLLGLIAFFALLVAPVNQLVFKPIFKILDAREARIAGTRERALQLERQADEVLSRYESSVQAVREEAELSRRGVLEGARSDAQGTTGEARSDAEHEIERARSDIASALEGARVSLRGESQQLAREVASRVLGRAL